MALFKSLPDMYEKEKDGRKPNTLRKFDASDVRFADLFQGLDKFIQIKNVATGETFIREVTDVTYWEDWCIISWKHEEVKQTKDLPSRTHDALKEENEQ